MNKLICSLFVILLWCQPGYAQSMLSLNDYFKKNPKWTKDPISVAYVFKRCGALYIYSSSLTTNKKQISSFKKASDTSLKFAHDVLVEEKNMSSSKATDIVFGALDKILMNYKNDGDKSYAATAEYTTSNYIGRDLGSCKGLVESIS